MTKAIRIENADTGGYEVRVYRRDAPPPLDAPTQMLTDYVQRLVVEEEARKQEDGEDGQQRAFEFEVLEVSVDKDGPDHAPPDAGRVPGLRRAGPH